MSALNRWALIVAGTLFVGLGTVGIFVPVLPTTPFLLLAAACYARSSERFYNWLLSNRFFGEYIRSYREGKGLPLRTKIALLCTLWLVIGFSAAFAVDAVLVRGILILIAIGVTVHIVKIHTLQQ